MPQEAVELAARRVDHNPDVSAPNYQVTRLWLLYPAKIFGPAIKIARTRIRIGKAGLLINGVHQVRAIAFSAHVDAFIQSHFDDFPAIVFGKGFGLVVCFCSHPAGGFGE